MNFQVCTIILNAYTKNVKKHYVHLVLLKPILTIVKLFKLIRGEPYFNQLENIWKKIISKNNLKLNNVKSSFADIIQKNLMKMIINKSTDATVDIELDALRKSIV